MFHVLFYVALFVVDVNALVIACAVCFAPEK